jgi:selenophosphate synthetase-related protein
VVLVDRAEIIDEEAEYGDEVVDMIDRTRNNPSAIILGTFHTYKTNYHGIVFESALIRLNQR